MKTTCKSSIQMRTMTLRLVLLTLISIIPNVISSTYSCGETSQCSVSCPITESSATGTNCKSMTINAASATNLTLNCGSSGSCEDLTIYANDLIINCNGDYQACKGSFTVSSTNPSYGFVLNCDGDASCYDLSLYVGNYSSRYAVLHMILLFVTWDNGPR